LCLVLDQQTREEQRVRELEEQRVRELEEQQARSSLTRSGKTRPEEPAASGSGEQPADPTANHRIGASGGQIGAADFTRDSSALTLI
jgi:hypothetical protein